MPSADPIRDVITHLSRQPGAKIEHQVDPLQPNRIGYRITGPTRECVQVAIDNLYAYVEGGSGYANFVGPARCEGGYHALGQVVLYGLQAFEPRVA